jgi:hypothetical protein
MRAGNRAELTCHLGGLANVEHVDLVEMFVEPVRADLRNAGE